MEPFYDCGNYVYLGETIVSQKVSILTGETYHVSPVNIENKWYGFVVNERGYCISIDMNKFKSLGDIRKETIDNILDKI